MGYNVAIDGPAGAGKSTIAKLVAKEKGTAGVYPQRLCCLRLCIICR